MNATRKDDEFLRRWQALEPGERRRLRRLVRIGRTSDADDADLCTRYARFQRARPWSRFFWIWFPVGFIVSLAAAAEIHPVAIGAVLALAAQGILAQRNLKRAAESGPDDSASGS